MAAPDHSQNFHPEVKAYLEAVGSLWQGYAVGEPIEKLRDIQRKVAKIYETGITKEYKGTREELFVDSQEVAGGIPIYVYKPKSVDHESNGVPILIYIHGGGNVIGSRDLVDDACRTLSSQAGIIVVSVEYRLAPEHKFPAMNNDGYAVVRWVLENRSKVGGTPKSIVGVSGDSAGGQIAASISHRLPGVDFQILIYPFLSGDDRRIPTYEEFKNGPVITKEYLKWLDGVVVEKKEDLLDPRFSILRNEKYDHLPPTLLIAAEFDPLRGDSYEYSKRLTAAGVKNELYLAKGAIHDFFTLPGAFGALCGPANAKAVEFINKVRKQHS